MINTQRVQALIERPSLVTAEDRDGLRGLVDRYPHSPGLAMLLARASQLAGHLDQQQDLLRAAAMLENREALFDLLVRPEILREARDVFVATEATEAPEPMEQTEPAGIAEPVTEPDPVPSAVPEEATNPAHAAPEPDEAPASDTATEAVEEVDEDGSSEVASGREAGDMEREVLLTAIQSTIELEVTEWEEEERLSRESDAVAASAEPESPPAEKKSEASHSYADWLRSRARAVSFGEVAKAKSDEAMDNSAATSMPKQDVNVLIDKFLDAKPKIGPIRDVDRGVEDLAKQSVLEDRTLVTETMARVFAKQGQIGRAKRIYQELALKYPAKSTYFAAQLKKLGKGG